MVASEHEEVLGVLDFVGHEQADALDGHFSSVDIVAEEEVVSISGESSVLEELYQIGILAVNVTWIRKWGYHRF